MVYSLRLFSLAVLCLCVLGSTATAAGRPDSGKSDPSATTAPLPADEAFVPTSEFTIPGPLRSFLRMAGISQRVTREEVLPLLGRNVLNQGYEGMERQTEFLLLLRRYVIQARELTALASNTGMVLRVTNCDDAKPLLRILGYRSRPNCGDPSASLQTADPERAFLTIDSGFPLPELDQALQTGKPFEYPYSGSSVPVLFTESEWTMASRKNSRENSRDLIDTILLNPSLARLYWAFSRLDPETAITLNQSIGITKLLAYSGILDFYGSRIAIRDGRVQVPGGPAAAAAWSDLVGASPDSSATFIRKLLARDKGWLTAYFDVLSRVTKTQQAYFTEPHRLRLFYDGLRLQDPAGSATIGSFRPAPSMLLLATRLQLEADGTPLIPGGLPVWKEILQQKGIPRFVKSWRKSRSLSNPDDLVQIMFAFSREADTGPLSVFLATSELDARRPAGHRLAPDTVRLLARKFEDFSDQYRTFSEFPQLSDASIRLFLDVAAGLSDIPNPARGNALGAFQAGVGMWQILARQGQIPEAQLDSSWQQVVKPFGQARSAAQIFDAGRSSLTELFRAATGKPRPSQDEIIELLAGPAQTSADGKRMHQEVAARIRSVLDGQRLVSLDTLLTLGEAINDRAQGKTTEEYVFRLAGQLREFEMPRPIFTSGERTEWAAGIYNNSHTEAEMRTDLAKVLRSPSVSRTQLEEARGHLASFLRDTLVGLNYAYYEPPGAQALHDNPLFVRSHDFAAETISGIKTVWQSPELIGQGSPAGGGAHFVGSLADLAYALADVEQDFIAPENVQALIWKELTPGLLTSAVLPRWWDVSADELHAVALYQRAGEELLGASATDEQLRGKVVAILSERVLARQSGQLAHTLLAGNVAAVLARLTPADTFYLTAEFQRRYPGEMGSKGSDAKELQDLLLLRAEQIDWKRLSHDFGVPHPSMAQTYSRELLNVTPMPAFSGVSSRFLAESWDSSNLYWARLADEKGMSPVTMNRLVPELTRHMVAKIFATDFEDWTALLRAMRETGDDFREGKLEVVPITPAQP